MAKKIGTFSGETDQIPAESKPIENRELFELVDEYAANPEDPIQFAKELNQRNLTTTQYECIVPKMEVECLEMIDLFSDYELEFRGDTLSEEELVGLANEELIVKPCVRNRKLTFESRRDRFRCLIELLDAICKVRHIASRYEEINSKGDPEKYTSTKPIIVYGFMRLEDIDEENTYGDNEIRFHGWGSDSGATIRKPKFIEFPKNTSWIERGVGNEDQKLFPVLPRHYEETDPEIYKENRRRINRYTKYAGGDRTASDAVFDVVVLMAQPKAHFNYLLLAHKMLSDIREFDRAQKGGRSPIPSS